MKTPLYSTLVQYSQEKKSFHMPGHKFGSFKELKSIDMTLLDATEANGLDNLYEAEGIIAEAMKLMATFYGAKETIFLTNGSTAGVIASILAVCKPGEKILVARNCHHSVWSALILSGAIPIYVDPDYDWEKDIIGQIKAEEIEAALKLHPDIKGAIIVSPTYEGITSPIKDIARILHQNNKILIVDEAHGAHFVIHNVFPDTAIKQGADIVINSMHKTLPTLTQSGLVHLCSERIEKAYFISCLKMIQTSSPSYMMMGIMDYVRGYILEHMDEVEKTYIEPLKKVRHSLLNLSYLKLFDQNIKEYDISKIIIMTHNTDINGYELAKLLEEKYQIMVEAALPNSIILMTTMADTDISLKSLEMALISIDKDLSKRQITCNQSGKMAYPLNMQDAAIGISPRDAHFSKHKWVEIKSAKGEIAANNIMLYPPGIPIIAIGEYINEYHIQVIEKLQDRVLGLDEGRTHIEVVCE